jgi:hypothetical protein
MGCGTHSKRCTHGQYLARNVPERQHGRGRLPPDIAGACVPTERTRIVRHDRQRLGMDDRFLGTPARSPESQHHPTEPQSHECGGELPGVRRQRAGATARPEGGLPSVRPETLPPIPRTCAEGESGRQSGLRHRVSVRSHSAPITGIALSWVDNTQKDVDKSNCRRTLTAVLPR